MQKNTAMATREAFCLLLDVLLKLLKGSIMKKLRRCSECGSRRKKSHENNNICPVIPDKKEKDYVHAPSFWRFRRRAKLAKAMNLSS